MKHNRVRLTIAILMLLMVFPLAAGAQLMIIGNDEKATWDDAGKVVLTAPGKDTVSIVDISKRESPRIVSNLPLTNSVFGPPANLAITPRSSDRSNETAGTNPLRSRNTVGDRPRLAAVPPTLIPPLVRTAPPVTPLPLTVSVLPAAAL